MKPLFYLLPVAAYLYGAVPYGFLMAKLIRGVDIREVGSGNIGATNAARVLGWKFFPVVFLLDLSKGFLPTLAARLLAGEGAGHHPHPLAVLTAAAAVAGHVFPVYLSFKGGKAVAAGAGAFIVLAPGALAIGFVVWAVVFALWHYVSLASICAAAALGASLWLLPGEPLGSGVYRTAFGTVAAVMVIFLHRTNIKRLLAGTEHKVGRSKKDDGGGGSSPRGR